MAVTVAVSQTIDRQPAMQPGQQQQQQQQQQRSEAGRLINGADDE